MTYPCSKDLSHRKIYIFHVPQEIVMVNANRLDVRGVPDSLQDRFKSRCKELNYKQGDVVSDLIGDWLDD